MNSVYNLEERLLEYAADVIRLCEALPASQSGRHVSGQLLRSGTAPMAHHGEAQAAESRKDFIHKMKVAHKELRESIRWIRLIERVPLSDDLTKVRVLKQETDELIRIFHSSIRTAKRKESS